MRERRRRQTEGELSLASLCRKGLMLLDQGPTLRASLNLNTSIKTTSKYSPVAGEGFNRVL